MSINICRDNNDPFYRYKMPPIQARVEGKGNGIKTAVLNAADVARALNRPVAYIIKYFGFELGAQTSISVDKDRYLVNGAHQPSKLQDVLDGFINKFVLCGSCKNPETEIDITKDDLARGCKACGQSTLMDLRHKLSLFILKNPPDSMKDGSKKKKKAATALANVRGGGISISDIAQGRSQAEVGDAEEGEYFDDDELARQINAAASNLEKIEVNDDEWAVDISEEAVRARAMEIQGVDGSIVKYSILEEFGDWILSELRDSEQNCLNDIEIYKKAAELELLQDPKLACVLGQVLFDSNVVSQISEHSQLLQKLFVNAEFEKQFLGGLERFLGLDHQELIPLFPKILLQLYNEDIISEEQIIKFSTKCSKRFVPKYISKKVRRAAKPFIIWLENADSDEDSKEESD